MTLREWQMRHGVTDAAMQELYSMVHPTTTNSAPHSESHIQSLIRLEAPRHGAMLLRNNSGACKDETGRLIRFGLGNDSERVNQAFKSSDLIGITPVGDVGVFTAVEVKKPGWTGPTNDRERAQAAFLLHVQRLGGIGIFATCVEDYAHAVREARTK